MNPRLVHPVIITIEPFDSTATEIDSVIDDLKLPENIEGEITEPDVKAKYKTAITVKGQVSYNKYKEMTGNPAGLELRGEGYLLVNLTDNAKININDRISNIDGDDVAFYVTGKFPAAHYKSKNFWLVEFDYETKGLVNNAQL
jgi:hypothetical protein